MKARRFTRFGRAGHLMRKIAESQRPLYELAQRDIRFWQAVRAEGLADADVVFYGIVGTIQILSAEKLGAAMDQEPLKSIFEKMKAIEDREGLGPDEEFYPNGPDTPDDFKALFREWQRINQSIVVEVMRGYGEDELADLFLNDPDEFDRRYEAAEIVFTRQQKQAGDRETGIKNGA